MPEKRDRTKQVKLFYNPHSRGAEEQICDMQGRLMAKGYDVIAVPHDDADMLCHNDHIVWGLTAMAEYVKTKLLVT